MIVWSHRASGFAKVATEEISEKTQTIPSSNRRDPSLLVLQHGVGQM